VDGVGEAGDIGVALLDDAQSKDREVHADDAATNRLPLALAGATGAGVAVTEKESDTGRVHNTLLHGEALLVVSTSDPEDVALELVADAVTGDLMTHAALHEDAELALVFDLDQLLRAIVGVGDVELHLDGGVVMAGGSCNVSRLSMLETRSALDVFRRPPRLGSAVGGLTFARGLGGSIVPRVSLDPLLALNDIVGEHSLHLFM
jgi:hypothetical protein